MQQIGPHLAHEILNSIDNSLLKLGLHFNILVQPLRLGSEDHLTQLFVQPVGACFKRKAARLQCRQLQQVVAQS
ncbi:hypothetical protein D3C73_1191840 [compost metagenome]